MQNKRAQKATTIKDIAQLAGVSVATVSRALNGGNEVSAQTRERILQICARKQYRINALARGLVCQKTNVLGLMVPEITNPFYSELAFHIETYAAVCGYNVILCNTRYDDRITGELFEFLLSQRVEGIILASSRNDSARWVQKYKHQIPVVLMGSVRDRAADQIHSVGIDNERGGALAAEYLLQLGHRHLIYMGYRRNSIAHQKRFEGFERVCVEAGARLQVVRNYAEGSSLEKGYALSRRLFSKGMEATALFAATDSVALGVLQAADECGIQIPEQLSLVGFDNIVYASLPKIRLTSVDQQKETFARTAVDLLLERLNGLHSESGVRYWIEPILVRRESSLPIPDGDQQKTGEREV